MYISYILFAVEKTVLNNTTIGIWLGVTDLEVDGTFKYDSDGALLPFTPEWSVNEPTVNSTENCVQLYNMSEKWHVENCGELSLSICEMLA